MMDTSSYLIYGFLAIGTALFLRSLFRGRTLSLSLDNIPGPPSHSFWKGNVEQFFTRHGQKFQEDVALNYGSIVRLQGLFGHKMLYVADPKALNTVIIKEDNIFEETDAFFASNSLLFGPSLLSTMGDHHRKQRKMMNPVFSVNHMRHMLPIFYDVIYKLRDTILAEVGSKESEVDVLEWSGRAALELIGQGGLGFSFDPWNRESRNEYGDALKQLLPNLTQVEILRRFLPYVHGYGPVWFRRLVLDMFPNAQVQKIKTVVDTMTDKSVEIFESKKTALQKGDEAAVKQVGEGKDIMSILIRANSVASEADRLPERELIAQMSTFIFAATDTTSNTLAHILQLLAEHQDVQSKLRQEILEAGAGSRISYDELNKLRLLDGVCRETLRLYPAAPIILRVARKDTVLPLSDPIRGLNGKMMHEIPIPKGTDIIVGMLGSNANKARWGEDSLQWKPERWLSPLPTAVTDAPIPGVYSNLMTFLGGKRACIGFKFSEMEMKVVLSVLLTHFTFQSTDKPVVWNIAGVNYPTVGKDSNLPQLPLMVGLYKGGMA